MLDRVAILFSFFVSLLLSMYSRSILRVNLCLAILSTLNINVLSRKSDIGAEIEHGYIMY